MTEPSRRAATGDAPTRLRPRTMLVGFALILGAVLLVATVASFLADAPEPPPECAPGTECGGPPGEPGPSSAPGPTFAVVPTAPPGTVGIRAGQPWASPDRAFEFEFSKWWSIDTSDGNRVDLAFQGPGDALLIVASVPAAEASPDAYADRWAGIIAGEAPDLRIDTSNKNTILGPGIGFVDGVGRSYAGTLTSPQSATAPIGVSLVTASDGRTTAAVVLIVWNPDSRVGSTWLQHAVRGTAELVLKTFRWAPP